ncbi:AMP-binding protein [Hymenobacter sp. ASUV-10]|uniref:AMP-binding protein n=1 Tax=Hymenobacter aranciens TaxID=3063996 RepID=A0ABT9BFK2_9BACT|nr:AMP-binding protein [Hymenobacter sp. ASUV-10]MDO7875817.1 AMP-binding protein [Hymenobacter sp. ASUV-10]
MALRQQLAYLAHNSPYYQRQFREQHINVADIRTVADLARLPFTTKDDLQRHNWDFLCVPRNQVAEYSSTSGTLGEPVIIGLTKNDLARLYRNEYLSFGCADGGADDVYQLMLTLDRQFMAGIAYYGGLLELGAGIIRVGPGNLAAQLANIQQLQPTALVAVPSFISNLLAFAQEQNINLNDSSIRKIVCIGESIRQEDFQLNALAQKITGQWPNVQLYSTYASTEKQTAFTECGQGQGGHHQPELIVFEIVNEGGQLLKAGETGELVITNLGVEGMPLLRYKTGDLCAYYDAPCACGRTTRRLGPIVGRKQQLIKYKGTTLYPQTIFNVLNSFAEIAAYVVEASRSALGTDELTVTVAFRSEDWVEAPARLRQALQAGLRVLPTLLVAPLPAVLARQQADGKRKPSVFIDRR